MGKPWVPYVVQQGDHLDRLAFRFGTNANALWSNEKNKDLAAKRKNRDTLCPGDVLYVPREPVAPLELHAHSKNSFVAKVPKVPVKLRVLPAKRPVNGKKFEIDGAGGSKPLEGTVSGDGEVAFEVPVWVREVTLRIPEASVVLQLRIGDLDPIDEQSGVTQRLHNLGYLQSTQRVPADQLAAAIREFQQDHGLDVTGAIDDKTLEALADACAR
jgi:N-acetylmuramoyl-L-alanine amidase